MKKKGLIISTVVMVVVLIASLTTATYAWFTAETQTKIDGFDIEVAAGSAVVVGFKSGENWNQLAAAGALSDSLFQSGNITFDKEGNTGWTGDAEGLTPTLTPTFEIGTNLNGKYVMETAVAKTTAANATDASDANTFYWANDKNATKVIKANKGKNGALANQADAVANTDYAHFILGAQASKSLDSLVLAITVQSDGKTTLGMAAATHIAYRTTANGEWTEKDVFEGKTANTKKTEVLAYNLDGTGGDTGVTAIRKEAGSATVYIPLDAVAINQIEIVIYLAGNDPDCVDAAKGATAKITMDFIAKETAA